MWKEIPGWEDLYAASDGGQICSIRRDGGGIKRVLAPSKDWQGRLSVVLCREGETSRYNVRTLVLYTFVGPRPEGLFGCNIDGDKDNNGVKNIAWKTRAEIMALANKQGRHAGRPQKLTAKQVKEILKSKDSCRVAAKIYGVSQSLISRVRNK